MSLKTKCDLKFPVFLSAVKRWACCRGRHQFAGGRPWTVAEWGLPFGTQVPGSHRDLA